MTLLRLACQSEGVPEIFRSVQGEGVNSGRERTFIRLSDCNLHCVWCDTPYTWNWEGTRWPHVLDEPAKPHKFSRDKETMRLSVEDVATAVAALPAEGVVVTGGEPLLQSKALVELIDRLLRDQPSLLIEIETNGTIAPTDALARAVGLFMVSPKLRHARNRGEIAIRLPALRAFAALDTAAFKFVARTPDDLADVRQLTDELGIGRARVYVMPEGTDSRTVSRIGASLADPVLAAGFNFSDRLHIHLYGDKRGR